MKAFVIIIVMLCVQINSKSEEAYFSEGYWSYDIVYMSKIFDAILLITPDDKKDLQKDRNVKLMKLLSTSVMRITRNKSISLMGIKKYTYKYETKVVDEKNIQLNYLEKDKVIKIELLSDSDIFFVDGKMKSKLKKISKEDALLLVEKNNEFYKVKHTIEFDDSVE